jgi:hypothetical protein
MFQKEAADRAASRRTRAAFPEGFGPLFVKSSAGQPSGGTIPATFSSICAVLSPDTEKQSEPKPQEDKADKNKDK